MSYNTLYSGYAETWQIMLPRILGAPRDKLIKDSTWSGICDKVESLAKRYHVDFAPTDFHNGYGILKFNFSHKRIADFSEMLTEINTIFSNYKVESKYVKCETSLQNKTNLEDILRKIDADKSNANVPNHDEESE